MDQHMLLVEELAVLFPRRQAMLPLVTRLVRASVPAPLVSACSWPTT
jgi:hypothetical protein